MQRPLRLLASAVLVISAGLLSQPAGAIGLPGAQGVQGAIEDSAVVDKVHCRPGWWHHRFRPHDGCFRRYRYYDHGYYPGYYGYGPGFYGPGISLSIGPRFGFGHHRRHW
jgi:hypothetical protein